MWYTSVPEDAAQTFADGFTKESGIKVEIVRLATADVIQRFSAESEAGTSKADVLSVARSGFANQGVEKGWLTPLDEADLSGYPGDFPATFLRDDGATAVPAVLLSVIAYNTDDVAESDVPHEFTDLLDPKWKGKVILSDPTTSGSYVAQWAALDAKIGGDFLSQLGGQDLIVLGSGAPASAALSAGEGDVNIPQTVAAVAALQADGAPIDYVTPETTSGAEFEILLAADAPHTEAAKTFVEYQLSKSGSEALADASGGVSAYSPDFPANYVEPDLSATEPDAAQKVYEALGVG